MRCEGEAFLSPTIRSFAEPVPLGCALLGCCSEPLLPLHSQTGRPGQLEVGVSLAQVGWALAVSLEDTENTRRWAYFKIITGHLSQGCLPLPLLEAGGDFDLHCENLVGVPEVKLTKVGVGAQDWAPQGSLIAHRPPPEVGQL